MIIIIITYNIITCIIIEALEAKINCYIFGSQSIFIHCLNWLSFNLEININDLVPVNEKHIPCSRKV